MYYLTDYPFVVLVVSLAALWGSAQVGVLLHKKLRPMEESERDDFNVVSAATMTLLGLIIGFSFAMAISRYDQRKNYEEDEANAKLAISPSTKRSILEPDSCKLNFGWLCKPLLRRTQIPWSRSA